MKVSALILAFLLLTASHAFPDSVTLNDGEVIQGEIVSETDAQVVVEVSNYNKTITSHRSILKSDIKTIQRESAQQKQERLAYDALAKLQLNPNQEQSTDYCTQGITRFEKFLADYPNSDKATIIQQRLDAWRSELKHVADGEVKFGDKWMTPEEKKPLVDHWQKQINVQSVQNTLQSLKKQLADLQRQRSTLAGSIVEVQGKVAALQTKLASLQDTTVPVYQTTTTHYDPAGRLVPGPTTTSLKPVGTQTVPNPEKPRVQSDIAFYQQQVVSGQQNLSALDAKIGGLQAQIPKTEQDYKVALARLSEPLPQPAAKPVAAPAPAPVVEPVAAPEPVAPPPPPPKPWIVRNWKGIAIAVGILIVLPILAYLLLRRADRVQKVREQQARAAREELKKIFDRVFVEGVRPAGKNSPEGDIVPIGKGQDAYGGGRWFVIGPTHIWAVQNNGREGDNWVYNNVITDGPGAIGACIPIEPDTADTIRTLANAAS